jgi:hypothetical protein
MSNNWVEVNDHGVGVLLIGLERAQRDIKDRVADVFVATGPMFVREMQRVVRVDTGTLQKSLHFQVNRRMPRLRLGSLKRNKNPKSGQLAQTYAGYVHSGTWKMAANPYIDIAIEKHTTAQGKFMRGIRKAMDLPGSTGGVTL